MKKILLLMLTTVLCILQGWGQAVIFPQAQQAGTAQVSTADNVYTLYNDLLSASFLKNDGKLFFNGCEAMGLQAGTELFRIVLSDGTEVAASAMTMGEVTTTTLAADPSAAKGALKLPGKAIETTFTYGNLSMNWRAVLRDGSHYLRTELVLTASANVTFKSVIPMIYSVDNSSSEQAPAVVGNTRGAVIASDKIFAGLETPMGKNTIVGSLPTEAFTYNAWTGSTFSWHPDSETPQGIRDLNLPNDYICGIQGYLGILEAGTHTVTFQYTSGSHKLEIAGVDVVNLSGSVVASDYHKGFSGGANSNNVYTLNIPERGYYLVRYFRDLTEEKNGSITTAFNSNGTITWTGNIIAPELVYDGDTGSNELPQADSPAPVGTTPELTPIALDGATQSDTWANNSWSAVSSVPESIADFGFNSANVVQKETNVGFESAGGALSAHLVYSSGSHRLNIVGMELIDASGNVASADYHIGYTGGAHNYNTYTVFVPATGDYRLRYYCETQTETITSSGNITLTYASVSSLGNGGTRADAWTTTSWNTVTNVPSEITDIDAQYVNPYVKVMEKTANFTVAGLLNAQFMYASGSNGLSIVAVELVDAAGIVVATDYHKGFSGNAKTNHNYSFFVPKAGKYRLRYYCENKTEANTSSGNINLTMTEYPLLAVSGSRTDAWTPSSWTVVGSVPSRIIEVGYNSPNVRSYTKTVRFSEAGGTFNAQFMYSSGNHGLTIAGVELVDGNGSVVASDYHSGFSGNAKTNHNYTFTVPTAGFYQLIYYVNLNSDNSDNTSSGNINLSYNKTYYLHFAAPTETDIQGEWSRQTTLASGKSWKVSTVVGLIAPGQARRSFLCYSERERAVPWRAFPMYNSWFELNIDRNNSLDYSGNFTEAQCEAVLDQWKTHLFDAYGVGIGSFVWDDGWDEYGTWEFNTNFPNGFSKLSNKAWAMDSQIGAWLGPVGGYGQSGTYRRNYWSSRGGMQLSNPDYYDVFLTRTSYMLNNFHFNFFKFDGISAQFSATGPDNGTTGEENAEGIIDIELKLREVKPDVFLNTTVGTWASPFWFQMTDAVWRQENDWGTIGNQGNSREQWITYRDRLVYQNFVQNSPLCPINTLMTHGFILSEYGGGVASMSTNYDDIVREMRCAFACGSGMVEVYADYALMNSINGGALWGDLAECIKWQKAQEDVLPDVHWVGGNPWDGAKANVYGWASWNGKKATLALRNPSATPQTFTTTLREALDIPDYISTYVTLSDAFTQGTLTGLTTGTPINIDTELTLTLAASSVYIYNGVDAVPLSLSANEDNTSAISSASGQRRRVTLADHTFYKDGDWNTLCLPFDVSIEDSPLEGADVRALSSASLIGNTLTLNFTADGDVTSIEAGTPYVIKWASGDNLVNPVFEAVTINDTNRDFVSTDGNVQFKGTYSILTFDTEAPNILFLGENNTLYYPGNGAIIGAQHAYFQLSDGANVKSIMLNFNGEPNAIVSLAPDSTPLGGENWYDLGGRKIVKSSDRKLPKGVYINNGNKIVIR